MTRICIASLRRFYPSIPIKLLVGGRLIHGLEEELARYWGVASAAFPRRDYGWGFVKLEPLFESAGQRFLMVDSDTALSGPILDYLKDSDFPFIVDNEEYPIDVIPTRYYDWKKVQKIDPKARPPAFVFNSGQWIGTSGLICREDFDNWVEWSFPRRLKHPALFFPGEQGVLNYVLVQKNMLEGLKVARKQLMHWPGYGMNELTAQKIQSGQAQPAIIHWAGVKKMRIGKMEGSQILDQYERDYFSRLPLGRIRRRTALIPIFARHYRHGLSTWLTLAIRKIRSIMIRNSAH